MKSGIVLLILALAAAGGFVWIQTRPETAIERLIAASTPLPDAVETGNRKIDELGRHVVEIKFPDGHTEWSVDLDAQLAASK
jgi:hypothetical protein